MRDRIFICNQKTSINVLPSTFWCRPAQPVNGSGRLEGADSIVEKVLTEHQYLSEKLQPDTAHVIIVLNFRTYISSARQRSGKDTQGP
jgi:hypothetical protein